MITCPGCVYVSLLGSDVVDWLFHHVEGFSDRREARKYASNLLKAGYIRHTVNKITFSEQCYYIFGDLCGSKSLFNMATKIVLYALTVNWTFKPIALRRAGHILNSITTHIEINFPKNWSVVPHINKLTTSTKK